MGQKTHPRGFRLVTQDNHLSRWYSDKYSYASLIEEDFFIRSLIEKNFEGLLSLSKIEIYRVNSEGRKAESVHICISSLFPSTKDIINKVSEYIASEKESEVNLSPSINEEKSVRDKTNYSIRQLGRETLRLLQSHQSKKYYLRFHFLKNPFENALLIAKWMGAQLNDRLPYRRIIKQVMRKAKTSRMQGIKVEISGRLNGVEIARSEAKREGNIPLHTLRRNIDYAHHAIETPSGLIGLKVWLLVD